MVPYNPNMSLFPGIPIMAESAYPDDVGSLAGSKKMIFLVLITLLLSTSPIAFLIIITIPYFGQVRFWSEKNFQQRQHKYPFPAYQQNHAHEGELNFLPQNQRVQQQLMGITEGSEIIMSSQSMLSSQHIFCCPKV